MKRLFLLAALGFAACQTDPRGHLSGQVLDVWGRALPGVTVAVEGVADRIVTDETGAYTLRWTPGRFVVRYEAPGHAVVRRTWELYEAAETAAEAVRLLPMPSTPGVWMPEPAALAPVPPTAFDLQDPLGLAGVTERRAVVDARPMPWCAHLPLLARWPAPRPTPPFSAVRLGADGAFIVGGRGGEAARLSLDQAPLDPHTWAVTPTSLGGTVLLTERSPLTGAGPVAYALDVVRCEGGAP